MDKHDALLNAARKAAGDSKDSNFSNKEFEQYYSEAQEYLETILYLSEDEVEGILVSNFSTYSPKEAYMNITNEFK